MIVAFGGDVSGVTAVQVAAFIPAVILAAVLRFVLEWVLALSAFWLTKVSALNNLYFSLHLFLGGAFASAMTVTKGNFPGGHWSQEDDAEHEMEIGKAGDMYVKADNELTFNKLDSVFLSGNATRDDAPNHVRIQTRVPKEIAQTWVSMCPAQVYEIPEEQLENGAAEVDVHVTASNCVQCGAITAKGGRLTLPEGGDGPLYQET